MSDTSKIEWFGPHLTGKEIDRLSDVVRSGYLNDGPMAREFERRIAEILGVPHCIAVTSGTAALTLALIALGIGPGDEVIVPDLTFAATANAVRLAGASVKLVDVDLERFCIDPAAVKAAIGPSTRAVIPVDVNGRGAQYGVLEAICAEHGLALVCDAAEGLGSKYRNKSIGAYGDAACFSFSANKTITSGQGGIIATNNADVYNRLRELKDQGRRHGGTGGDDLHPVLGFNFKYTDLQAAVALAQLDAFNDRLKLAQLRDTNYCRLLKDVPGITLPSFGEPGEVRQWMDVLVDDRSAVIDSLNKHNIASRSFWLPLHQQAPYADDPSRFPNSTSISRRGLWLPSRFDLTESQMQRTVTAILEALGCRAAA